MDLDFENPGTVLESSTDAERPWKTVSLALEDATVQNGEQHSLNYGDLYIGPADYINGKHWQMGDDTTDLIRSFPDPTPRIVRKEDRNDAGFHIGNLSGYPYEIKLDEELPGYPETPHMHQVPEDYIPVNGTITMATPGENYPESPGKAAKKVSSIEDFSQQNLRQKYAGLFQFQEIQDPVRVQKNTLHYIESAEPKTNLIVSRGDSKRDVQRIIPTPNGFKLHQYFENNVKMQKQEEEK